MTPVEAAVLRLVARDGGTLCLSGRGWKDWDARGGRALPALAPAVVTRTVNRLIAAGLLAVGTGRPGTGTFARPTPAGARAARDQPPGRFERDGRIVYDMFRASYGGFVSVQDWHAPGAFLVAVGGGILDTVELRRLHAALGDALAEIDAPSKSG